MKKDCIYKLRHLVIIIVLLISLFTFTSCKKVDGYEDMKKTIHKEILNQKGNKDGTYYVVIYSTTCVNCEDMKPVVVDYYNFIKNNNCFNNKYPHLYVLNLNATKDNPEIKAADSEYRNFTGTSNYQDIKFAAAPALIVVTNGKVEKLISSKVTNRPKTDIEILLKKTMNEE